MNKIFMEGHGLDAAHLLYIIPSVISVRIPHI